MDISSLSLFIAISLVLYLNSVQSSSLAGNSSSISHLCSDPSFTSAVAISETQVLLFKADASIWILDLLNYRVHLAAFNFTTIEDCLKDAPKTDEEADYDPDKDSSPSDGRLYIWNQHDTFEYRRNALCIQGGSQLCGLTLGRDVKAENGVLIMRSQAPYVHLGEARCRKDILDRNTIQTMAMRTKFGLKKSTNSSQVPDSGVREVWLRGDAFKVHLSYYSGTYDSSSLFLRVLLSKEKGELNSIHSSVRHRTEKSSRNGGNSRRVIEGVQAYAILPTGELMIFFGGEFCYLSSSLKCSRRFISTLIGCAH